MKKQIFAYNSDSGVVFEAFEDGSARFALKRSAFDNAETIGVDIENADKVIFEYVGKFKGMSYVAINDFINKFYAFASNYSFANYKESGEVAKTKEDEKFIKNNFDSEQDCEDYLRDCFSDITEAIECGDGEALKAISFVPTKFYTDELCEVVENCVEKLKQYALKKWEELAPKAHTPWALLHVGEYVDINEMFSDADKLTEEIKKHYESSAYDFDDDETESDKPANTAAAKSLPSSINLGKKSRKKLNITKIIEKNFAGLVGLDDIKQQLKEIMAYVVQNKGKDEDLSLHMAFVGNPGTGKTTVAKIVAKVLTEFEILQNAEPVVVNAVSLQGKYMGHTAPLVKKMVDDGVGKVTLIDEAYALTAETGSDRGDFKKEVVSTLIPELETHRRDSCYIFAGYPKEMEAFLNMNPGLKSRIPNIIKFKDFSKQDICDIFDLMVKKSKKTIEPDVLEYAHGQLERISKTDNFANARGVRNVFMNIKYKQAVRVNGNPRNNKIIIDDVVSGVKAYEEKYGLTVAKTMGFGAEIEQTL